MYLNLFILYLNLRVAGRWSRGSSRLIEYGIIGIGIVGSRRWVALGLRTGARSWSWMGSGGSGSDTAIQSHLQTQLQSALYPTHNEWTSCRDTYIYILAYNSILLYHPLDGAT